MKAIERRDFMDLKFNRAWLMILAVSVAAGCSSGAGCNPTSPSGQMPSVVLLNATWEPGDLTVWNQLNGNSSLTTSTPADTGVGAGLFSFAAAAGVSEAYTDLTITPIGILEIDLSIRPETVSTSTLTEFHLIENGVDRAGLAWDSTGGAGQLKVRSGGTWLTISNANVSKGAWNRLGLEYSVATHQYTVWKNGKRLNTNYYSAGGTLNLRPGWGFDVLTNNSPGHTMLVDNVAVYY
jgi:hypothetical protein